MKDYSKALGIAKFMLCKGANPNETIPIAHGSSLKDLSEALIDCHKELLNEKAMVKEMTTIAAEHFNLEQKANKQLEEAEDAMEKGAFHHDACPWLRGQDCHCAHRHVVEWLVKREQQAPSLTKG